MFIDFMLSEIWAAYALSKARHRMPAQHDRDITALPYDVLQVIFSYCTRLCDAMSIRATCRTFKVVYETRILKIKKEGGSDKDFVSITLLWRVIHARDYYYTLEGRSYALLSLPRVGKIFSTLKKLDEGWETVNILKKLAKSEDIKNELKAFNRSVGTKDLPNIKKIFTKFLEVEREEAHALSRLTLPKSSIVFLPKEVGKFEELRYLDLSNNLLFSLPHTLTSLFNLNYLDLYGNRFRALPESIASLRQLRELGVDHNQLRTLPRWLLELPFLRMLNVKENPLFYRKNPDRRSNERIVSALRRKGTSVYVDRGALIAKFF